MEESFCKLKDLFTSEPILSHPNPQKHFIMKVGTGVGAVLSKRSGPKDKLHPCAYFSYQLSPAERNYNIGEFELLAIKLALGGWRRANGWKKLLSLS